MNVSSLHSVNASLSTANDSEMGVSAYFEDTARLVIINWIFPVVIFVGTVGNILSIAVLIRARMRTTSVYFYLMVLSFADLCVLYVSGFKTWIRGVTGYELLTASRFACKTTMFLVLFSQHFSAWLVVLTTVDRFIAVWFPFRASVWCSVSRARLLTVALTVVISAYNGHVFWTMSLHDRPDVGGAGGGPKKTPPPPGVYCGGHPGSAFMRAPFEYLKLVSYSMLPFVVILTLNILIIARLKWSTVYLNQPDNGSTRLTYPGSGAAAASAAFGRHAKVTYMLLSVSFTYLLLTGPFTVFSLPIPRIADSSSHLVAKLMLVKAFVFIMMYCNHAVNFFLYCLTGRKFRCELKEVLKRGFEKNRTFTAYSPSTKTQPTKLEIELRQATTR